jgi:hypothetical protein
MDSSLNIYKENVLIASVRNDNNRLSVWSRKDCESNENVQRRVKGKGVEKSREGGISYMPRGLHFLQRLCICCIELSSQRPAPVIE